MTVTIKVYSDYVCPFCFLAEKPLEEAIKNKDVKVEWMPYELRPYPNPTLRPEEDYLQTTWKQSVYPMADRMGVKIVLPRVSPQPHTHLAFEGYQYAKEHDKGNEYNDRMLRAFFQEERDIGDAEVLCTLAGEVGLNVAEYREALETRKYKEKHKEALDHAYNEAAISAVPTFLVGETVLQGVRNKETLESVINEELGRQQQGLVHLGEGAVCGIDSDVC